MDLFCLAGDENYDKICGQILFTTKGRLAFYCTLCGQYWSYGAFITHLLENCSQLVDDDLKECISLKSLTGRTGPVVKKPKLLHQVSSALVAPSKAKVVVQSVETLIPNQEESMNCEFLPHSPHVNYMQLQKVVSVEPVCADGSIQFDFEVDKTINESFNQDLIEVDYCDENVNEYENFEYLEDEPIEEEIQNNYLFETNETVEATDDLQSCSVNNEDNEIDYKPNEKHKHNKSKKTFVDEVSVPLVVRNVQARKKYFPSHIAPEERKFKCPVCGAAFKDRTNRNYHLRRHTNNKKHSCPDCGKKFYTSTEVRIHSRVHSKPENQFLCTECGRSFESNFKLSNHQKRHTNQRDYVCKECNKGFFQLEGLKAHMSVHSSARPYTCEVCAATFKRPHILKAHMKQHENKREYKCQLCEAAFNVQAGLHSHMKSKHKEFVQID